MSRVKMTPGLPDTHLSYAAHMPDRLLLKLTADLTQITGIQTRLQLQGLLVYTF